MSETNPKLTLTLTDAAGETLTLTGRGVVAFVVEPYNGSDHIRNVQAVTVGELNAADIGRQIAYTMTAPDREEDGTPEFWRDVIAFVLMAMARGAKGEDIINRLTPDEAFAMDAMDKAEGDPHE